MGSIAVAYSALLQPIGCNQAAHYALVKSLSEGTPRIDRYREETCDAAYIGGHYYAAKAPGLAFASLPWYAALDAAGLVPENPGQGKGWPQAMLEMPRRAVWQLHLWSVVIPALVLVLLVRRVAERLEPGTGWVVGATFGLGTLLLPFATDFFAHVLSACLGFAAFVVLFRERRREGRLPPVFAAGVLAGLAAVVEFPLAVIGAAVGLYALIGRPRLRRGAAYAGGVVLGAAPLASFNLWAFGSVTRLSYENAVIEPGVSGHDVVGANAPGFFGLRLPLPRVGLELLFSAKGLLVLSPVLAVAAVGLVLLYRRGMRAEALLGGGIAVAFLVYNAGYVVPFGGYVPGPRFLLPSLPFLALGLAPAYRAMPGAAIGTTAASIGAMILATAAEPMLGGFVTWSWVERWRDGNFAQSVVTLVNGAHGWGAVAPFLAAAALAAALAATMVPTRLARREGLSAVAWVAAWVLVLVAAPDLLGTDRRLGSGWGALALVVVLAAIGLLLARARTATAIAAAPLALLLLPGFPAHTLQVLGVAAGCLALAVGMEVVRRRDAFGRPALGGGPT